MRSDCGQGDHPCFVGKLNIEDGDVVFIRLNDDVDQEVVDQVDGTFRVLIDQLSVNAVAFVTQFEFDIVKVREAESIEDDRVLYGIWLRNKRKWYVESSNHLLINNVFYTDNLAIARMHMLNLEGYGYAYACVAEVLSDGTPRIIVRKYGYEDDVLYGIVDGNGDLCLDFQTQKPYVTDNIAEARDIINHFAEKSLPHGTKCETVLSFDDMAEHINKTGHKIVRVQMSSDDEITLIGDCKDEE